jgi:hypothetical protein
MWYVYKCKICGNKISYLFEEGTQKKFIHTLCECQTQGDDKFCTDYLLTEERYTNN